MYRLRMRAGGRGSFVPVMRDLPWRGIGAVEIRRDRYNGQDFSLKGGNDRFVLPAEFRKAVRDAGEGERVLCLQMDPNLPCLLGFGLSRQAELDEQLAEEQAQANREGRTFNRQLRSSQLFGFTKVPFDESGRFVLPPRFQKHAKVGDGLYFHGAGAEILIFNPEELMKLGDEWNHMKMACEDHMDLVMTAKRRK